MATVMVVDDSVTVLRSAEHYLSAHRVIACESGTRALEIIRDQPVDLVVTDIYMPDIDGLQLLRALRRAYPRLPVITMSGLGGRWNMLPVSKAMGACGALEKPFSSEDLIAAVTAALAQVPPHHP